MAGGEGGRIGESPKNVNARASWGRSGLRPYMIVPAFGQYWRGELGGNWRDWGKLRRGGVAAKI
jgi:hypothetical protein